MQNSSDKSQSKQDERRNGVEGSPMMTIEYLRARLLSERSISKATKERADELAKRVKELEEQLKVVTLHRKRAEKAALDILSYLDSLGVGDISEVYESDSNEEESECESDMDNGDTTKDDKTFGLLEIRRNGKEPLGSDLESIPSSGKSLSWKGRKESTGLLVKKSVKSSIRGRDCVTQVNSSPRHRGGKSCRKIKRREPRSTVEESRHDSGKSDAQDNNAMNCLDRCLDCLDFQSEASKKSPEPCIERGSGKDEVSHSSQSQTHEYNAGSSTRERECNGEMERALQHQAQLIRCYEAQEKAQRDWEEKYGENNDSCEPGSHSDVTEERDENKVAVSQPIEVDACHDHKAETQTNSLGRKQSITYFNSFKLSPDADVGSSKKQNVSEIQLPGSPTHDFAFSVANCNQSLERAARHSLRAGHVEPSYSGSDSYEPEPPQRNDSRALVPHEEPSARLVTVLEALQEAKLRIKQQMNSPETRRSVERTIETSITANRDVDWLKFPVGCPGLFRVPTDLGGQAPGQSRLLSSDYSSELTNSTLNTRTLAAQGHQYISSPMSSRLSVPNGDPFFTTLDISNQQPRFDFDFNTNVSASSHSNELTHSSYPDFFPRVTSNLMGNHFLGNEAGIPQSGYPSFLNQDVRPNTYR